MASLYPGDLNGYQGISDRDREYMYRQMVDRVNLTIMPPIYAIDPWASTPQPEENQKLLLLEDLS
jgi:hypothetical protein